MKVLVIRFGAIGDLVLATPLLRCLKAAGHNVHLLVARQYHELVSANPNIDSIHHYDISERLNERLRVAGFDAIIDLQNDTSSNYLARKLRVKTWSAPRKHWTAFLLQIKHRGSVKEHQVDRYFEALKPLGVSNDGEGLDHYIPAASEVPYSDIPTAHQLGFLALVIGGSAKTKRLPIGQLTKFCASLAHPVILLGSAEDAARGEALAQIDPIKIYNACGKFTLQEGADLLRKSKLVVAHDTGLMHIAAALKKPVITIWGSTVPAQGMTPYYGSKHAARNPDLPENVQVEKLWCRPCTNSGRAECPLGHFKCMKKIDVGQLLVKSEARLWKRD